MCAQPASDNPARLTATPLPSPNHPLAETLHAIQHTEPQRFAQLVGGLDANVQAAVQGMMQYAAQVKAEKEQAAAQVAAQGAANGHA